MWGLSIGIVTLLASIFVNSTEPKQLKNILRLSRVFGADKLLQLVGQDSQAAELKFESNPDCQSPCLSSDNDWQSLQKNITKEKRKFQLQNQWQGKQSPGGSRGTASLVGAGQQRHSKGWSDRKHKYRVFQSGQKSLLAATCLL